MKNTFILLAALFTWCAAAIGQMRPNLTTNTVKIVALNAVERDPDANNYCDALGITDNQSRVNVSGFVRTLKLANVWTSLVDCCLLRSNYNTPALANVTTWKGIVPTVYGAPGYGSFGTS